MAHLLVQIDNLLEMLDDLEAGATDLSKYAIKSTGDNGWPAAKVRQTFIDFFCEKHGHLHKPSSPVIPHDDPTLLFANAGMNQFKPIFLGEVDPLSPMASWKRAANSQKCIRAGGKHNDLEDVGKDVYHHTFFEMLGNWSFGDYFKEGAIDMAWELLTKVYCLDPNRLYATYFEGDEAQGVPCDDEARKFWLKYLPPERVIPFDAKDNFWEMGETGPCGPCTELHYDRIGGRSCPQLVNMDDPDVLEIWNLVFMQFNRQEDGSLVELPAQHVDTGMGFERITSCLQDKPSNYDTDVFTPIFDSIQEITGCNKGYRGRVGAADDDNLDMAYRVVADHIRNLTVAITDGAQPGAQGRNSVLRTVLRRMCRYGKMLREAGDKPAEISYLYKIVPAVTSTLGGAFPELNDKVEFVQRIIKMEEEKFYNLLVRGEKRLNGIIEKLKRNGKDILPGDVVFKFWGSYGFPPELTELIAEEAGLKVDWEGYNQMDEFYKKKQKEVTKEAAFRTINQTEVSTLKSMKVGPTDSSAKFVQDSNFGCKLVAIWDGENFKDVVEDDTTVAFILDRSNYYYESGGQASDVGMLAGDEDRTFLVEDCQEFAKYVMHIGKADGKFSVGDSLICNVDYQNRNHILPNHSMTHVLNQGLRVHVGPEVDQHGSVNDSNKLTFDFNLPEKLSIYKIEKVEQFVNSVIKEGLPIFIEEVEKKKALEICSIRAMFPEKYPPMVRVVSIGIKLDEVLADPKNEMWMNYSIEFCGGTHLKNTAQAEKFYVISEEAVMEGIRRLTCVTGYEAENAFERGMALQNRVIDCFNLEGPELTEELRSIKGAMSQQIPLLKRRQLEEKISKLDDADKAQKKAAKKQLENIALEKLLSVDDTKPYHILRVNVRGDGKSIQSLAKTFSKKKKNLCAVLYDVCPDQKNKIIMKCVIPKKLSKKMSAKECFAPVAELIQGGAGGNATNATAQGKDDSKLSEVLKTVKSWFESKGL